MGKQIFNLKGILWSLDLQSSLGKTLPLVEYSAAQLAFETSMVSNTDLLVGQNNTQVLLKGVHKKKKTAQFFSLCKIKFSQKTPKVKVSLYYTW